MKCAEAIIKKLVEHGVTTVFGYPGANIAPLYDELKKSGIRHILSGNEQFSAMEAAGFSFSVGKPGICFVTSGPGATNAISGIANAWADSVPLIVFSGQVPLAKIGTDAFQEADITGAAAPFLKYSYLIKSPSEINRAIDEAFLLASTGRPGPVLIDIPLDVQLACAKHFDEGISLPGYKFSFPPDAEKISRAAQMINSSERPVVLAGGGAKNAAKFIAELGKKGIPVALTARAHGLIPCEDFNLGMAGIYGRIDSNRALKESDCVIIIGSRVSERTVTCEIKHSVHIDIDRAELSKNLNSYCIHSAAEEALPLLLPLIRERRLHIRRGEGGGKNLFSRYAEKIGETGFPVSVDVGQNMVFALRGLEGTRVISSLGLGSMGFSVPAAIGAASVSKTAFALTGDGGLNMSLPELFVIAQNMLNVKIAVMNNGGLGMIHELQKRSYNENYCAVSLSGMPNLKALASSYGFDYARVEAEADIADAVANALSHNGGFITEVISDIAESAF